MLAIHVVLVLAAYVPSDGRGDDGGACGDHRRGDSEVFLVTERWPAMGEDPVAREVSRRAGQIVQSDIRAMTTRG